MAKLVRLVAPAIILFGTTASANLIVNGSFEDDGGAFSSGAPVLSPGSAAITGWIVTRDTIDYVISGNGAFAAADGDRALDLDGTPGFGGIGQSFATEPGAMYRVTFSMAGNPFEWDSSEPEVKLMAVAAGGAQGNFSFDTSGKDGQNMGWVTNTWTFEAVASTTTLEFFSLDTAEAGYSGSFGPALDAVSVTVIPEPSTGLLFGLGLVGIRLQSSRNRLLAPR